MLSGNMLCICRPPGRVGSDALHLALQCFSWLRLQLLLVRLRLQAAGGQRHFCRGSKFETHGAALKAKVIESHLCLTTPGRPAGWEEPAGESKVPVFPRSSEREAGVGTGNLGPPWVSVHTGHVCPESELRIVVSLWNGAWPARAHRLQNGGKTNFSAVSRAGHLKTLRF